MRRKYCLIPLVLLILTLALPVSAHDVPDLSAQGTIAVTMEYRGEAVPGGSLTLYQVGTIVEDDGNYYFSILSPYPGEGILTEEEVVDPETAEELAKYAKNQNMPGIRQSLDDQGYTIFQYITPGLYLVVQDTAAKGYYPAAPFLVSLPGMEEGKYDYHVDASPKVSLEKAPETRPPSTTKPTDPKLPQTGQLNWPVPVLVSLGLALFAAGWFLCYGKKYET